jgi:hypothetical protein
MQKLLSFLGYTAAVLTIAAALLTPFLLMRVFTRAVAGTGIRINDAYSGGEPDNEIKHGDYWIIVNRPVRPSAPLQGLKPFVQVSWVPVGKLPLSIADVIDLDHDGRPDVAIRFDVPSDAKKPLEAEVKALTPLTSSGQLGRGSFSSMICRTGDRIVARLPWNRK